MQGRLLPPDSRQFDIKTAKAETKMLRFRIRWFKNTSFHRRAAIAAPTIAGQLKNAIGSCAITDG